MNKPKILELVQRQLDAYNKRDLELFLNCFHPEVQIARMPELNITFNGMDEFRRRYQILFESSPSLHCELKSRIAMGATVVDEEWITGAKKYPDGLHAVAIYAFRDGLIDRVWFLD